MAKTSEDLREFLFSTLVDLKAGRCHPDTANAISKITQQIISTVAVEIEYHKHVTKEGGGSAYAPRTQITLTRRDMSLDEGEAKPDKVEPSSRERITAIAGRAV